MKKTTYIFLLFFFKSHFLFSQNYFGIPYDTTAQWLVFAFVPDQNQFMCIIHYEYVYYISGDTVINGQYYHKLSSHGVHYEMQLSPTPCNNPNWVSYNQFDGYLRSDSGRVYFIRPTFTPETLLYDFNLNVGDTLPQTAIHGQNDIVTVSSIDSVQIGNTYRKRFHLDAGGISSWMIESIGHVGGLIEPMDILLDFSSEFKCYAERDTTFYSTGGAFCDYTLSIRNTSVNNFHVEVFPNPASGIIRLSIESEKNRNVKVIITDLLGRKLSEQKIVVETGKSYQEIFLDKINSGVCVLRIESDEVMIHRKIFIERALIR